MMNDESVAASQGRVGVIGLGSLGGAMCRLLMGDGYEIFGHDIDPERGAALAGDGVTLCDTPAQLAAQCDLVVLSLPQSQAVEAVCLGNDGIARSARPGLLVVDTTSGYPDATRRIATTLAEGGAAMLDAAITGEQGGAGALPQRALTFCVGGTADDLARALPVLERMATHVFHVGPLGAGQTVKMINNMVCAVAGLATIEGLLMAARHGIDVHQAAAVLDHGTGMSFFSRHSRLLTEPGLEGGFQLALMCKDLRHTAAFARDSGVPGLMTDHAHNIYQQMVAQAPQGADILRQVDVLQQWAGITLAGSQPSGKAGS